MIVVDLETSGLNYIKDKIIGVGFKPFKEYEYYFEWNNDIKKRIKKYMESRITKIFHNAKFDLHFLQEAGIELVGDFHDTMLMGRLLEERKSCSLENLAIRELGVEKWKYLVKDYMKKLKTKKYEDIPFEIMEIYAKYDVKYPDMLVEKLLPKLEKQGLMAVYNMEKELLPVVMAMERRGVLIDDVFLLKLDYNFYKEIKKIDDEIFKMVGYQFNIDGDDLYKALETLEIVLTAVSNKSGKYIVDEFVLNYIKHPIAKLIIEHRKKNRIRSTYCQNILKYIDKDNIVRANFHQMGNHRNPHRTSRFSCSQPNLQNTHPLIRKAFLVRKDYYNFFFDYKQLEYRILGHYAHIIDENSKLFEACCRGEDVHQVVADELGISRDSGKQLNFALAYGMGVSKFAKKLNISLWKAKKYIIDYFARYPELYKLRKATKDAIYSRGYVKTTIGRRLRLDTKYSYMSLNRLIQSSGGDIAKLAMIKVYKILKGTNSYLIINEHDMLGVEVHKDELDLVPKIKKAMIEANNLNVPMDVDITYSKTNWSEKEAWNERRSG